MLDAIQEDGKRIVISQGIRKAHTRVGIHYHPSGGHTCVLTGEITDYSEGSDPVVYEAGTCFLMPKNTYMSATNQGDIDVVLQDTFIVPEGEVTTVMVEPGYPTFCQPIYA
jgi:quercetin dioxygenase-like cupin family protein